LVWLLDDDVYGTAPSHFSTSIIMPHMAENRRWFCPQTIKLSGMGPLEKALPDFC